jgi:hypothetical protein
MNSIRKCGIIARNGLTRYKNLNVTKGIMLLIIPVCDKFMSKVHSFRYYSIIHIIIFNKKFQPDLMFYSKL